MPLLSSFFISDSLCQSITIIVLTNPSSDVNNRWLTAKINKIFFCKVSRVSVYWLAICALLHWHHFPLLPSCSDLSHSLHTGPVNIAFFTRILQLAKNCFRCQPLMWPWPWGSKHCPTTLSVCLSVCFRGRICLHVPEDHMANRVCNHSLQTHDNTDHSSNDHFSLQLFVLSDSLSFSLLLYFSAFFSAPCGTMLTRKLLHVRTKDSRGFWRQKERQVVSEQSVTSHRWMINTLQYYWLAGWKVFAVTTLCNSLFWWLLVQQFFPVCFFYIFTFHLSTRRTLCNLFFIMKTKLFFQFCYCCASSWIAVKIIFAG